MKELSKKSEFAATLKYAGAFIACLIGSGFSTGQEILQFFSSYGAKSAVALLVNFIGSAAIGIILILNGYDHKDKISFTLFDHYCGSFIGKIYNIIIVLILVISIAVSFSGTGAVFDEYFSLNRYACSAGMAVIAFAVYLIGFEKMERIISVFSPLVIIFAVFVGAYTLIKDFGTLKDFSSLGGELSEFQAAPHWSLSAILYISLNFFSGSIFYTELGRSAVSRRSAKCGAMIGAVVMLITLSVMTFAILINGGAISKVEVPTLFLANKISGVFGSVFVIALLLGIFSTSTTGVWSFCSLFYRDNKRKNTVISAAMISGCLILGFIPLGKLISILYPIIGYAGIFFIICVMIRPIRDKFANKKQEKTNATDK